MRRRAPRSGGFSMKIEFLEETDSTSKYIKRYVPFRENVAVCAKRQTGGRGTKGRSFLSEEGGVYLSFLTFYEDLPAAQLFRVMAHAAVSVCRTAERFGVFPRIKWSNDILAGGKKLCGILIENRLEGDRVDYSIVGIGLNVTNDVTPLGGVAARLSDYVPEVRAEEVRVELLRRYGEPSTFNDYLSRVDFLGKSVRVVEGEREYIAVARRILADGRLEVEQDGAVRALSSAEISLRLLREET